MRRWKVELTTGGKKIIEAVATCSLDRYAIAENISGDVDAVALSLDFLVMMGLVERIIRTHHISFWQRRTEIVYMATDLGRARLEEGKTDG
jgi:hypothetical protein